MRSFSSTTREALEFCKHISKYFNIHLQKIVIHCFQTGLIVISRSELDVCTTTRKTWVRLKFSTDVKVAVASRQAIANYQVYFYRKKFFMKLISTSKVA